MKKKIAILGSTGSIGKILLKIIKKDKKNFVIQLLSANRDYNTLFKQAKEFNVKNIIITNKKSFKIALDKFKNTNLKIYNNFNCFKKIFKNKNDYVMSSIVGLNGLEPTINIIKYTKKLAIANKESIICGWNLLKKEMQKHKTEFVPIDSEHFTIWYGLKNNFDTVNKIYLTASGGPFIKYPVSKFKKIKVSQAIKHPNWKMGKKISIDSATMMNKVFEVIEAKKIFNLSYKNLSILTHPLSYVHSIIVFSNGLIKIVAHETDMIIPISNSLYKNFNEKKKNFLNVNLNKLNNLELKKIDEQKFKLTRIINMLPENDSLFETVVVAANDELVNLFLNNKIRFDDIFKILLKIVRHPSFNKYKKTKPKSIDDIIKLNNYVRLKVNSKRI